MQQGWIKSKSVEQILTYHEDLVSAFMFKENDMSRDTGS